MTPSSSQSFIIHFVGYHSIDWYTIVILEIYIPPAPSAQLSKTTQGRALTVEKGKDRTKAHHVGVGHSRHLPFFLWRAPREASKSPRLRALVSQKPPCEPPSSSTKMNEWIDSWKAFGRKLWATSLQLNDGTFIVEAAALFGSLGIDWE